MLEGSVVMQLRGGKEVTLRPGQSFYEDPNDIHVVSRNASSTKSARFLVFLIHKKGAPLVIPAKQTNNCERSCSQKLNSGGNT
jgi:quercetin dioxygenase-like cupin family protein